MKNRILRIAAGSVLVIALAACQGGSIGGAAVSIKTAPAVAQACMDALAGGRLAVNNQSGLGITSADGQALAVEWPFGYTARTELGTTVLVDEAGRVVARVGDEITVGGGFGNQFWHACGPVTVTKAGT